MAIFLKECPVKTSKDFSVFGHCENTNTIIGPLRYALTLTGPSPALINFPKLQTGKNFKTNSTTVRYFSTAFQ